MGMGFELAPDHLPHNLGISLPRERFQAPPLPLLEWVCTEAVRTHRRELDR